MSYRQELMTLKKNTDNALERFICRYILQNYCNDDEIKTFFLDLESHGCVSGMINPLITYTQTKRFFFKFYDEIEELRIEYEDNTGEAVRIDATDLANQLAWFGFEQMAVKISYQIGAEEN